MERPETLSACPFCGSNEVTASGDRDTGKDGHVWCEKCEGAIEWAETRSLAVEAWNRRAGAGRASQDSGGKQLVSSAWLDALVESVVALRLAHDGADKAGEEFSRDEIYTCIVTLEQLHRRKR